MQKTNNLGNLASIPNQETSEFLSSMYGQEVWVGGINPRNDIWRWADGTRFRFKNWAEGYPKVIKRGNIAISPLDSNPYSISHGYWRNYDGKEKKSFICQNK